MESRRNPDQTRQAILEAAFKEIYQNGFQAASLTNILANTKVTKGALYHHFPNKMALGYALVEELIWNVLSETWLKPLEIRDDPISSLQETLKNGPKHMEQENILQGCPLNNLALEMSSLDEGFRQRINKIYDLWRRGIADALSRGQRNGKVRKDILPLNTATFIVASFAGCQSVAKNSQNLEVLFACMESLSGYLETLRL